MTVRLRLKRLLEGPERTSSIKPERIDLITKISSRSDYNRLIDRSINF